MTTRPTEEHAEPGWVAATAAREASAAASVLIVDDDLAAVRLCEAALSGTVATVRFAADGQQALDRLHEQPADLVLLDASMPGVDGFEVCRRIKADPALRHIPVVFVTQRLDVAFENRALELGAADFVRKPYSPVVLRNRVANLLQLHRYHQQALQAAQAHWQKVGEARVLDIVAAATDGIVSIDTAGSVVLINAAACRQFGIAEAEALGRQARDLLPGPLEERRRGGDRRLPRGSTPSSQVMPVERRDGASFLAEVIVFHTGHGNDQLTTVFIRDVSDRQRIEQAERARLQAEATNRAKSLFLSYIAHEIGNPLNGVAGMAELMATDTTNMLPAPQATRLVHLRTAASQLNHLLKDLLDLSRRELGSFAVQAEAADVSELARQALLGIGPTAAASGVTLRATGLDGLPATAWVDQLRLRQCLDNLLSNAIKYNRSGGWVELRLLRHGQQLRLEVEDSGIGMTEEQTAQLFEPFNRLGRADSIVRGSGLGLALTRNLLTAMGASIHVTSALSRGSCFAITLAQQAPA